MAANYSFAYTEAHRGTMCQNCIKPWHMHMLKHMQVPNISSQMFPPHPLSEFELPMYPMNPHYMFAKISLHSRDEAS